MEGTGWGKGEAPWRRQSREGRETSMEERRQGGERTFHGWGRAGRRGNLPWKGEDKEDREPFLDGGGQGERRLSIEGQERGSREPSMIGREQRGEGTFHGKRRAGRQGTIHGVEKARGKGTLHGGNKVGGKVDSTSRSMGRGRRKPPFEVQSMMEGTSHEKESKDYPWREHGGETGDTPKKGSSKGTESHPPPLDWKDQGR